MLNLEQKRQAFFATRTANYLASMRLEGIIPDDAQHASADLSSAPLFPPHTPMLATAAEMAQIRRD